MYQNSTARMTSRAATMSAATGNQATAALVRRSGPTTATAKEHTAANTIVTTDISRPAQSRTSVRPLNTVSGGEAQPVVVHMIHASKPTAAAVTLSS
jgi:hypothetical protein